MRKDEVIMELQGYIDTLKNDDRTRIKGLKIVICESNWVRKKKGECNFIIEWDTER